MYLYVYKNIDNIDICVSISIETSKSFLISCSNFEKSHQKLFNSFKRTRYNTLYIFINIFPKRQSNLQFHKNII